MDVKIRDYFSKPKEVHQQKNVGNLVLNKQTWRGTTKQKVISNNGIEAAGEIRKVVCNRIMQS
jgi:hypothetical protein